MFHGKSVVLIGFMGAGKTSLGKAAARTLHIPFLDTDDMIEQAEGMSINEIFAKKGEAYFREAETRTLQELADRPDRFVLSVGGGMPLREENRPLLRKAGCVIYLNPGIDALEERLRYDTQRPLLRQGEGTLYEKIERILQVRDPLYREAADVMIDNGKESFMETVNRIVSLVS